MGWATRHIEDLTAGKTVQCRPKGNSMAPLIHSGDLVEIAPLVCDPAVGDIVLCKVKGNQYLHLVSAKKGEQYQISNRKGFVNGWCSRQSIYGLVTKVSK